MERGGPAQQHICYAYSYDSWGMVEGMMVEVIKDKLFYKTVFVVLAEDDCENMKQSWKYWSR